MKKEVFKEIKITQISKTYQFEIYEEVQFGHKDLEDYKLLMLEMKSDEPLTNTRLIIDYVQGENSLERMSIDLIKYFRKLEFRNGFHYLHMEDVPEFSKIVLPRTINIFDERNPTLKATLFYTANYSS